MHTMCLFTSADLVRMKRLSTRAVFLYFRQVHVLNTVVWKDGRAQTHVLGRVLFEIDKYIAVRYRRGVFKSLLNELDAPRIHLSSQVRHLRCITRILEHHHVLRIQTDGTTLFVFGEQVLYEIQHGRVPVMTFFSEQGRDPFVLFCHEIVYDDEVPRRRIEHARTRQPFLEPHVDQVRRCVSLLPFSVTTRDLFGGWIDHRSSVTQHTRHESTFAASRRTGDDARERMFPPRVHGRL